MSDSQLPPPNLEMNENISPHSSSSSFVPIEEHHIQDAIQVINEAKEFNPNLLDYITKSTPSASNDKKYHVISVFGSQSTGKSTLLNKLFNTNFDVMDETRRQQTTKGIWMAYAPTVSNTKHLKSQNENIFVMDVEGTDGRERGEDQDFERKAALFALSTSEILIINVWETQIGLYQGANMGLLKTVFEVNLTLFGKAKLNKSNNHKVLLLFVIRDHIGVTPKENLASTVTQDLINMWDNLNKPNELSHMKFEDFFDISFHTLGHKVLQPENFANDVQLLGDRVINKDNAEYLFKPQYHHEIPIDGWTLYAENCWDQIDNNKDLDLPTQQILVAKFKCDEILSNVYEEFLLKFNEQHLIKIPKLNEKLTDDIDYEDLGLSFIDLKNDVLENFDVSASRYNQSIYEQKRITLIGKLNDKFKEIFEAYAQYLLGNTIKLFTNVLNSGKRNLPGKNFQDGVVSLSNKYTQEYSKALKFLSLGGELDTTGYEDKLNKQVEELISKQQLIELNNTINKSAKKVNNGLVKAITFELGDLKDDTWDTILNKFNQLTKEVLSKYESSNGAYDFGLGTSDKLNNLAIESFKFKSWVNFYDSIHKYILKDGLINILQDRFDDKFRYDDNGLPKLYENSTELESSFEKAKKFSLQILPILTRAKLSNGKDIKPEYDIFNKHLNQKYTTINETEQVQASYTDSEDEDEEISSDSFSIIVNEEEKQLVLNKFKREVDAKFVETKRSIIQHVTQIPYYIYLIILVLGWNEFMAILRNPLFFTLLILLGGAVYVMYLLNLLKPAMAVGQRMLDEALDIAKQKLKEFVIDDPAQHGHNLNKISNKKSPTEEIELDDLNN